MCALKHSLKRYSPINGVPSITYRRANANASPSAERFTSARLILADEPTGNLDPANKKRILDLLFEQAEASGATLVMVTHDHAFWIGLSR